MDITVKWIYSGNLVTSDSQQRTKTGSNSLSVVFYNYSMSKTNKEFSWSFKKLHIRTYKLFTSTYKFTKTLSKKKKNKFTKTDNTTRSSFNFLLLLLLLLFFMSTPLFFSPWRVLNSRHIIHKYLFRLLLLGPSFQSKHGRKVAAGSRSHGYFLLCLFSQLSIIVND
jgi:hypothetical protein